MPQPVAPANGRGAGARRLLAGQQSGQGAGIASAYESVCPGWHGRMRKKSSGREGTAINRPLAVITGPDLGSRGFSTPPIRVPALETR